MINCIIFSFDRPQNVRLLIESINKNAVGVFNINVIYKFSSPEFEKGYQKLIKEDFNVNWISGNQDFKEATLSAISDNYEHICFFKDSDFLYHEIFEQEITQHFQDEDVFCLSLRLGYNTTWCFKMNTKNLLHGQEEIGDFIKWDWSKHYLDYGYPYSMEGGIYRTKDISKLIKKVNFTSAATLESGLEAFDNYPRNKMVAYKHNVMVGLYPPKDYKAGSIDSLNQKYLKGQIIDFEKIELMDIIGCYQHIQFKFKKNGRN